MIVNPIIPIWLMGIISIILIILVLYKRINKQVIGKIMIIIFLFIINMRPMIHTSDTEVFENNLDVLFVIDTTISMVAEDYDSKIPRIEAVKDDCKYIIENLVGGRYSIITFDNESQTMIPYTRDTSAVIDVLDIISETDELYAKGSSLNVAKSAIKKSLEVSKEKEDRERIVFFISDGEITNEDKLESFSELKKSISGGAVLGYGTTSGGKMKVYDRYSETTAYLEDKSDYPYTKAISKIDEDNLEEIADDMGIEYIHMTEQENIDKKIKEIKKEFLNENGSSNKSGYTDIYYIFAILLFILLVYEYINYKRRMAI